MRPEKFFASGGADDGIVYLSLAVLAVPLEARYFRRLNGWGPTGRLALLVASQLALAAPFSLLCFDGGEDISLRALWLAILLASAAFSVREIAWGAKVAVIRRTPNGR